MTQCSQCKKQTCEVATSTDKTDPLHFYWDKKMNWSSVQVWPPWAIDLLRRGTNKACRCSLSLSDSSITDESVPCKIVKRGKDGIKLRGSPHLLWYAVWWYGCGKSKVSIHKAAMTPLVLDARGLCPLGYYYSIQCIHLSGKGEHRCSFMGNGDSPWSWR